MTRKMTIVGICRFSMIGRGDWKAYRNVEDKDLEPIFKEKEKELFSEERMAARFETFEQLTLASLDAQTDPDFKLLVISSDRMPKTYRQKLQALCDARPYVELRFVPPMHVADAQIKTLEKEKELFSEERMAARFETFEQLTLASLDAQTDPDFKLLVISSDRMPKTYRQKLQALCDARPYVELRFVPPMHVADAQIKTLE